MVGSFVGMGIMIVGTMVSILISTVGVLPILGATDDGGSSIGTVHRLGAAEL
jgi:hypothetical protein